MLRCWSASLVHLGAAIPTQAHDALLAQLVHDAVCQCCVDTVVWFIGISELFCRMRISRPFFFRVNTFIIGVICPIKHVAHIFFICG